MNSSTWVGRVANEEWLVSSSTISRAWMRSAIGWGQSSVPGCPSVHRRPEDEIHRHFGVEVRIHPAAVPDLGDGCSADAYLVCSYPLAFGRVELRLADELGVDRAKFGRPVAAGGNPYFGSAPMTAGARNAILGAMAAMLPSATCTPAPRGTGRCGFPVASGDLDTLQVVGAAHAGTCSNILDDGTCP
jgi:hypothetical protein